MIRLPKHLSLIIICYNEKDIFINVFPGTGGNLC